MLLFYILTKITLIKVMHIFWR